MGNKNRKKIFTVPNNLPPIETHIFKDKEVESSEEELKKQKELKQRLEKLKKIKEIENKKLEELEKIQEQELKNIENKIEDIKTYKEGDTNNAVYGKFLENQSEDGVKVKIYDSDNCNKFDYSVTETSFQESLKDFFKDIPAIINENSSSTRKVDKIIMDSPKEIKKPDTPLDFTKNVKSFIDKRKNIDNPHYLKPEIPLNKNKEKVLHIDEQIIHSHNDSVLISSGRSKGPISRTSSKLSNYKRGM